MSRFRVYGYALCVMSYALAPLLGVAALIVFTCGGRLSLYVFLGLTCAFLSLIFVGGERLLIRLYNACDPISDHHFPFLASSLERSLESVLLSKHSLPRIRLIQHPTWVALPVRSFFSPGTLLISQGLLAALSEKELLLLFKELVCALHRPGSLFQIFRWVLLYPFRPTREPVLSPGIGLYLLFLFPVGWALNEMKRAAKEPEIYLLEREILQCNPEKQQHHRFEFHGI